MATSNSTPLLTVAIASYNRFDSLQRCLRALDRQTLPARSYDVVVVDNGATDGTAEKVTRLRDSLRYELTVVRLEENNGPAPGLDAAMRAARGEVVLSLGDDMLSRPNLLEEHWRCHQANPDPKVAVLGFIDWAPNITITPLMEYVTGESGSQFAYRGIRDPNNAGFQFAYITNLSFKRSFLDEQFMLFDPDLSEGYEDIELGYRMAGQGMRLVFHQAARADHEHTKSFASYCWRTYVAARNDPVFARRHSELDGPILAAGVIRSAGVAPLSREALEERIRALETPVRELEKLDFRRLEGVEIKGVRLDRTVKGALHGLYAQTIREIYGAGVAEGLQRVAPPTPLLAETVPFTVRAESASDLGRTMRAILRTTLNASLAIWIANPRRDPAVDRLARQLAASYRWVRVADDLNPPQLAGHLAGYLDASLTLWPGWLTDLLDRGAAERGVAVFDDARGLQCAVRRLATPTSLIGADGAVASCLTELPGFRLASTADASKPRLVPIPA